MTRNVRPALAIALALGAVLALSTLVPSAQPQPAAAGFVNIAPRAGIDFRHVNGASAARHLPEIMSGGGLFFDYDGDGWQDVFLVDGGSLVDPATAGRARHRLFRNRGNGTFEDATPRSGIAHAPVRHGRLRGRLRQRRLHRSVHHQRRAQHPLSQQLREVVRRRHASGRCRLELVRRQLRVRGCRSRRLRRPVRHQLRRRPPRQQRVLRRRRREAARLLPPAQFLAAGLGPVPQQRQRHLHRHQPEVGDRQPPRQRPRCRRRRLRR